VYGENNKIASSGIKERQNEVIIFETPIDNEVITDVIEFANPSIESLKPLV